MGHLDYPIGLPTDIPKGCILGVNYSGCHDSAVALISPSGTPVFAVALERLSRSKQDGRPLNAIFRQMPWDRIAKVAISAPMRLELPPQSGSKLLSDRLPKQRATAGLAHSSAFHQFIRDIPCEVISVGHQEAHAASAFWGSGFEESLCLTYDGGMFNDPWFGGLFRCGKSAGITPLDQFSTLHYSKVTTLYSFVTALLGFMPQRHEGKVMGLSAHGQPTDRSKALLARWFNEDYYEIERSLRWSNLYHEHKPPVLRPLADRMERFRNEIDGISSAELAATLQDFTEQHVLALLLRATERGWKLPRICLSGGLFSNVKLNSAVAAYGFDEVFVAPAMTDDGTALGAAWVAASQLPGFEARALQTVALGPRYSAAETWSEIAADSLTFTIPANPERELAELLAKGFTVAVFQGATEFGPRALGNRSILAEAADPAINRRLNERLGRSDFMPFAPLTRVEDASLCYGNIDRLRRAAAFMTVTVDCTEFLRESCPAIIHIDGTARPQLVDAKSNSLMYGILSEYRAITGKPSVINTSFNAHEEPIVSSPADAIRCFFRCHLDYLYFDCGALICSSENARAVARHSIEEQA